MQSHVEVQHPRAIYAALEPARAAQELVGMLPAHLWLSHQSRGDGHPVVTVPGYGGGNSSMALMRRYISRWGYEAHPWPLGRNMDPATTRNIDGVLEFMERVIATMSEQLHQIHRDTGRRVSLVGWSLGGLYARQLAARFPDLVRQVITLGSPFGDPRATILWPIMQRLINAPEPRPGELQRWNTMARVPVEVPNSIIWSRSDGFVHPSIACPPQGPLSENIHICSSHMGFGANPLAYYVLADRLAQPEGGWQPFARTRWRRMLFGSRTRD